MLLDRNSGMDSSEPMDGSPAADAVALADAAMPPGDTGIAGDDATISGQDATIPGQDATTPPGDGGFLADALPGDTGLPPEIDCTQRPPIFPRFDRFCTTAADCALGEVQIDCCGSLTVTGIASYELTRFQQAAAVCNSQYPGCACASRPTIADDGTSDQGSPAVAECRSFLCASTFPSLRTPCPAAGGGGLTCSSTASICVGRSPIGPAMDYHCEPIPTGCDANRTCSCAATTLCAAPFGQCSDRAVNQIDCECLICQ